MTKKETTAKKTVKTRKKKAAEPAVIEEKAVSALAVAEPEQAETENIPSEPEEVKTETKAEPLFDNVKVDEAVVNIAGSTPSKDFAVSVCKFFADNRHAALRVRYIGGGSGQQLTKAIMEANKLLSARGQVLSRYDFWTNESGKSINNVRLLLCDVLPNTVGQVIIGKKVEFVKLKAFAGREESVKTDGDN